MQLRTCLYGAIVAASFICACLASTWIRSPILFAADKPADPNLPVPKEESNCVRCHLTAGRELTEAVHTFAHSVHDLDAGVSCHDCHGGNLEDDAKAHFNEFGFIGTKLSAHLAKCQECHEDQHEMLAAGPHQWNHQKRLNIQRPLCVDCHGNHDIGNPPREFSMSLVCSECHRGYQGKFPEYANVTDAHDALWAAILDWQKNNPNSDSRVPEHLAENLAEIRASTSEIIHHAKPLDRKESEAIVQKINGFIKDIQSQAAADANSRSKEN